VVGSILHPFDTGRQLKLEPHALNLAEQLNLRPTICIPEPEK